MVGAYKRSTKWMISVLLVLGALFAGIPILWMLVSSLKPNNRIFAWPPRFIESTMTLDAFGKVFTDSVKLRYFFNSYLVSIIVVGLTLFIGTMAAYAFSRFKFPLKGLINTMIVSVQAIPPIVLMIPYMSLIVMLKLFNTYLALILTYAVTTLPYCVLMMTGYFNTLSMELDEAVLIDGGSRWTTLWKILLPISTPGLISVGMYTFMMAWNEYLFALVLTQTAEMRTVPIGINMLMGQHAYDWSQMMSMSVIGSIPVLVLFIFFQRYFIAGMTAGSVKG